jgi:hypothetical protein
MIQYWHGITVFEQVMIKLEKGEYDISELQMVALESCSYNHSNNVFIRFQTRIMLTM